MLAFIKGIKKGKNKVGVSWYAFFYGEKASEGSFEEKNEDEWMLVDRLWDYGWLVSGMMHH